MRQVVQVGNVVVLDESDSRSARDGTTNQVSNGLYTTDMWAFCLDEHASSLGSKHDACWS